MEELIEYAKRRWDDSCKNGTYEDCRYWAGYFDGAKAAKRKSDENKERLISKMKKRLESER